MLDLLLEALKQYGALGLLTGGAIAALIFVTRRYIIHLERAEARQTRAFEGVAEALTLSGIEQERMRHAVAGQGALARERHGEVLRAIQRIGAAR